MTTGRLSMAEILEIFTATGQHPLKFTAYDGSTAGQDDATLGLDLRTPRGATYLATAPGELGLARAYVSGDLQAHGVHPGDPYELLKTLTERVDFKRPSARVLANVVRSIGVEHILPIAPPPQEARPRWRRMANGLLHSKTRDAEAIHHHYDVSNNFYEWVLGPSMTYTCAVFPNAEASLEQAQENKYRLIFEKLRLEPGDRLLDVGCGWGGMVRYAARRGVRVIGATLPAEQAKWGPESSRGRGIERPRAGAAFRLPRRSRDRFRRRFFDRANRAHRRQELPVLLRVSQVEVAHRRLAAQSLHHPPRQQVDVLCRRVHRPLRFPDGELTGSGRITTEIQQVGLEVLHEENFRHHYAMTLRDWCGNLVEHWDDAVAEVGLPTAKVWGLYMAASRVAFERNNLQLHHVLATKVDPGATTACHCGPGGSPRRCLSGARPARSAAARVQPLPGRDAATGRHGRLRRACAPLRRAEWNSLWGQGLRPWRSPRSLPADG